MNKLAKLQQVLQEFGIDEEDLEQLLVKKNRVTKRKQSRKSKAQREPKEYDDSTHQRKQRRISKKIRNSNHNNEQAFDSKQWRKNRSSPSKRGQACRTESMQTGQRPNNFENDAIRFSAKNDIEKDKKLWGNNEPSPRLARAPKEIEATCTRCGSVWLVDSRYVYRDDSGIVFICDECANAARNNNG
jgi:hypothetical protein